jgi:hypothetical protein
LVAAQKNFERCHLQRLKLFTAVGDDVKKILSAIGNSGKKIFLKPNKNHF